MGRFESSFHFTFSCHFCEYEATYKSIVMRHQESVHEGVTFSCDQYAKIFSHKTDLRRHRNSIHEGFKYLCNLISVITRQHHIRHFIITSELIMKIFHLNANIVSITQNIKTSFNITRNLSMKALHISATCGISKLYTKAV